MYKAHRTPAGYVVLFVDGQGLARLIDGATIHKHKQAAYRKAAQLNEKGESMKQVVEWITREGRFITEVETRYRTEENELEHSKGAVQKFDEAGKVALLEKQIAGETPTEPYEREYEDPHMVRRTSSCIEERVKNR